MHRSVLANEHMPEEAPEHQGLEYALCMHYKNGICMPNKLNAINLPVFTVCYRLTLPLTRLDSVFVAGPQLIVQIPYSGKFLHGLYFMFLRFWRLNAGLFSK